MAVADLVTIRDRVAFGQGPYVAAPTWTDITNTADPAHAVRPTSGPFPTGRTSRGGSAEATTAVVRCGNVDGRYTPFRNGSPYFPMDGAYPYERAVEYPKGSGIWYPIWGGVFTGVRAGFEGAGRGIATLTFQQRSAQPAKRPLKSLVVGQILASSPAGFWPMDDPADAVSALDGRGVKYPVLQVAQTGSGGAIDFGVGDSPGPDAGGSRVAFTPVGDYGHYGLRGTVAIPYAGEFTMAAIVQCAYNTTFFARNVLLHAFDVFSGGFTAYLNSAGQLVVVVVKPFVGAVATITSTSTVGDNTERAVGFTVTTAAGTSTIRLWVDGVVEASATFATFSITIASLIVGAENWLYGTTISPFNGTVANLGLWSTSLASMQAVYAGSLTGYDTDTADVRFARLTALAGIPAAWTATKGTFTRRIVTTATAGRTLSDMLTELETAEGGRLSVDAQGRLVLASSSAYYTPARTLTLSALTHFDAPDDIGTDTDGLVNTWSGNIIDGDTLTVIDEDSQNDRGLATDTDTDVPLVFEDDLLQVGFWKVNTTSSPRPRLATVVAYGAKLHESGLLDDALALAEGDRLILTDLPTSAPYSTFTGMVERVEVDFGNGDALTLTFTVSEWVDISEWDSATIGRWAEDDGSITLSAGITSSATSFTVATAVGSPPLTNAAGDLPFDITVDGERMTVTAVSAATSPQTLTVTRGLAPTYGMAHSSGAAVSIWNPGLLGI